MKTPAEYLQTAGEVLAHAIDAANNNDFDVALMKIAAAMEASKRAVVRMKALKALQAPEPEPAVNEAVAAPVPMPDEALAEIQRAFAHRVPVEPYPPLFQYRRARIFAAHPQHPPAQRGAANPIVFGDDVRFEFPAGQFVQDRVAGGGGVREGAVMPGAVEAVVADYFREIAGIVDANVIRGIPAGGPVPDAVVAATIEHIRQFMDGPAVADPVDVGAADALFAQPRLYAAANPVDEIPVPAARQAGPHDPF